MTTNKHLKNKDDIKKGVQKKVHINQYGDQTEHGDIKERSSEKASPTGATITAAGNAVQENARKDAKLRAQAQDKHEGK